MCFGALWVYVGTLPRRLVERPEVLNSVDVDPATDVLSGAVVVNGLVIELGPETDIAIGLVGVDSRTRLDPVTNPCLQCLGRYRFPNCRNYRATALQRAVDGNLVGSTSAVILGLVVNIVHAFGESTNVGFVGLDKTRQLLLGSTCHRKTNPVIHGPCRLLSDAKRTAQFMRRNAVLEIGDQPNGGKPLGESKTRVLEGGTDLQRELTLAIGALPNLASGDERGLVVAATGAHNNAIGPAKAFDKLKTAALFREVADSLDQRVWEFGSGVLHESIIPGVCDMLSVP